MLYLVFEASHSFHLQMSTAWLIFLNPVLRKLVKRVPGQFILKNTFIRSTLLIRIVIWSVADIFSMSYVYLSLCSFIIRWQLQYIYNSCLVMFCIFFVSYENSFDTLFGWEEKKIKKKKRSYRKINVLYTINKITIYYWSERSYFFPFYFYFEMQ